MRRKTDHPVLLRHRALSRRRTLGAVCAAGSLLTAPMALHAVGSGRELVAEAWLVAFVCFVVLAWLSERR